MAIAAKKLFGGRMVLTKADPTQMQKMARYMWLPMLLMGLMVIAASLALGIAVADATSSYFGLPAQVREAAGAPAGAIDDRQFIESTNVWLPGFQLLGIGLLLSAITFSLANILGVFRSGGIRLQKALGGEAQALTPPITARLFPMLMMAGLMVLISALVISIVVAFIAGDVYGNPISTIGGAEAGSGLLDNLRTVETFSAWLQSFAFVGLALVLSGIVLALYTIARVLRFQHERIAQLAEGAE